MTKTVECVFCWSDFDPDERMDFGVVNTSFGTYFMCEECKNE